MSENIKKKIIINTKRGIYNLPLDMLIYMEKDKRRIIAHTYQGNIEFYGKFSELESVLDDRFMHCHRSYIINMDEIVVMTGGGIYLSNNESIYFGRDTYGRGRKIFEKYLENKFSKMN